jgi:hypothetical protein
MGCVIDEQRYFSEKRYIPLTMSEKRSVLVPIKMTPNERSNLHKAAKAQGHSAAELIRRGLKSQGVQL